MGIILGDLVDNNRSQDCNWWNWRPTMEIMAKSGVVDADRLERMSYNGGGAEVTANEARRIADYVAKEVLAKMAESEELKPGGRISNQGRWAGPVSQAPAPESLYGANREWLESFVAFCRECQGFGVY